MERKSSFDKRPEETTRSTGKSGKSGPRRWETEQYRYKEELTDYHRPLHGDPRSKSERPQLDELDNNFSDDDGDHGWPPCLRYRGATPYLYDSASSASDQGTLAGGQWSERVFDKAVKEDQERDRLFWQWREKSDKWNDYNTNTPKDEWSLETSKRWSQLENDARKKWMEK